MDEKITVGSAFKSRLTHKIIVVREIFRNELLLYWEDGSGSPFLMHEKTMWMASFHWERIR